MTLLFYELILSQAFDVEKNPNLQDLAGRT